MVSLNRSVTMKCEPRDSCVYFEYVGAAAELIAAGAAEPSMLRPGAKGKRRVDSHGNYFRRTTMKNDRLRIERWIRDERYARELPGAPPDVSIELEGRQHEECEPIDADRQTTPAPSRPDRVARFLKTAAPTSLSVLIRGGLLLASEQSGLRLREADEMRLLDLVDVFDRHFRDALRQAKLLPIGAPDLRLVINNEGP